MANPKPTTARVDTQPLPSEQDATQELLVGLHAKQKNVNPKYFYDQRGSQLFEKIMALPEYYPTRTEISILKQYADDIAQHLGNNLQLIEPGAGNCEKVRYLLDALQPACYLPMDISPEFLQQAVNQLIADFNWLRVHPIAADFNQPIALPAFPADSKVVVFYPGSTIGNFAPAAAIQFLTRVADWVKPNGGILLGVDLQKDPAILNAAYNDQQGITEQFNLNVLNHVNSVLNSDFDTEKFSHRAYYNDQAHRIEMHLVANRAHQVNLGADAIHFAQGETIHTENSYKYTLTGIDELAQQAGLKLQQSWCDDDKFFSMNYLVVDD